MIAILTSIQSQVQISSQAHSVKIPAPLLRSWHQSCPLGKCCSRLTLALRRQLTYCSDRLPRIRVTTLLYMPTTAHRQHPRKTARYSYMHYS